MFNYNSLHACIQAGLVAARGVLMQNTFLNALVEDGDGHAVLLGYILAIAFEESLAEAAQDSAQLAFVRAVYRGLRDCLTGAL